MSVTISIKNLFASKVADLDQGTTEFTPCALIRQPSIGILFMDIRLIYGNVRSIEVTRHTLPR